MKKQKVVHGDDTSFLADEIITNILKRLPVKSLIRFQRVCKRWKNLVKSPSFVLEHHHHNGNQNPSSRLFKQRGDAPLNLFVVDCYEMQQEAFDVRKTPGSSEVPTIYGTCNGLICVKYPTDVGKYCLFLWNPATKEVRRVAGVMDRKVYYNAFEFSPIDNDYKIVKINGSADGVKGVEVYSLNTDCWRKIEFGNIKNVRTFFPHVSVNGSIFWYVSMRNDGGPGGSIHANGIVSFDTGMEVFTMIPLPSGHMRCNHSAVIVHDKKLVLVRFAGLGGFDCWVMEEEEEGVDASFAGKKWSWRMIRNNDDPYLSHLAAKSPTLFPDCGGFGYALYYYVESLLPITSRQHSHSQ